MSNFIKLNRKLKDKAFYIKDSEKVHLWIHLLLSANWTEKEEILGGKPYLCKCGQFTTGRKQLSEQTGINESKIERILTYFEKTEQQIEQQKTSTNRLISITNWVNYQLTEQQFKQRVNNKRTTTEQQVDNGRTHYKNKEEYKESKEYKINIPSFEEFKNYVLENEPSIELKSLELKYKSWIENDWKDGYDKKIKNWKSKILNTIKFLPKTEKKLDRPKLQLFSNR